MAYVITDAGPLIALAKVDALFVPRDLFSRVRIPEAVWFECRAKPGEDSRRIEQAAHEGWLEVVSVSTAPSLLPSLGRGEVEALQLARRTEKSLLIVDDRLARREAMRHGLDFIGTVRVLHLAERRSIINDAEAMVERLAERGYRVSPLLLRQLEAPTPDDAHSRDGPDGSGWL